MIARSTLLFVVTSLVAACSGTQNTTDAPHTEPPPVSATPEPTSAPGALQAAHEAYLAGDFVAVGQRIHDVLLDPTSGQLAKDNAIELLDKSYEAQGGKMPSRFTFPPEITGMQLGVTNGHHPHKAYRTLFLWFRVREGLAAHVTNISVRRLPAEPLLDLASNRGKRKLRHDLAGYEDVVIEAGDLDTLPASGVFSIRIDIDHRPVVDTWILASKLVASAFPEISSPTSAAATVEERPVVRWKPFRSPEFAPFEQRTLGIYVHHMDTDKVAWNLWSSQPGELDTVRIGEHADAAKAKLAPGAYWLAFSAGEGRSFGPIMIDRRAQVGIPFNVVK